MTGVGWVQWLIDGLFFAAGLLIGALVLHEVQMWRAMRRRGGMLEDFRMVPTVSPQPFAWAWPQPPSVMVQGPDRTIRPRLEIIPPLDEAGGRDDEADAS